MPPDVVGIGAINLDYVYEGPPARDDPRPSLEVGRETLNVPSDEIEELIATQFHRGTIVSREVGGSAYLAIRTIASMRVGLSTGYVGVLGARTQADEKHGFPQLDATGFLSDKQWLFLSDSPPGRSLVHTWKGQRLEIQIAPGANTKLLRRVHAEPDGANSLSSYLASARWVHVSSLPAFADFQEVMTIVGRAKSLNRSLRCSVDPGYEYVRYHRNALAKSLEIADLVFLSRTEAEMLWRGRGKRGIGSVVGMPIGPLTKLVVVKGKATSLLIEQAGEDRIATRRFWHRRLLATSIKNDTGAGDVFAGGFIASLLMDNLLGSQPSASQLAANLAAVRLRSRDFPDLEIAKATQAFVELNRRQESANTRQRIQVAWAAHQGWILFLAGAIASYVVTSLLDYVLGNI